MSRCWELIEPERPDETLLSLLESYDPEDDEKTALFFWDGQRPLWCQREISYGDLRNFSLKFGAALSDLGVLPKERVLILLPNSPQFVISYFGVLANGSIAVPLNPLYTVNEICNILKDSGAETIILWDKLFPPLLDALREKFRMKNIIVTGVEDSLPSLKRFFYKIKAKKNGELFDFKNCPKNVKSFSKLIEGVRAKTDFPKISPKDIAVILYTSGTTSDPKGVAHTHESLLANAKSCVIAYPELTHLPPDRKPVFLAAAPYFHIMGIVTMLHLPLILRAKIVLLPRPQGEAIVAATGFIKATVFIGVPRMFGSIIAVLKKKTAEFDLPSLDICISGAVEIPEELKNDFEKVKEGNGDLEKIGKEIYIGYGMSETGITHCQKRELKKHGSVGSLFSGFEQKILNPDDNGVGEILIRGKGVMLGYWSRGIGVDKEKTSKFIDSEGWFHTGDLGKIDRDGVLFFAGRLKDMIKGLGGENIYPGEIERVLTAHPLVAEAAVIGVKDKKWGEKIKAFLVLKDPESAKNFSQKDILDYCRKQLAPFKIPHEIEYMPELPKNFAGKVLKKELTLLNKDSI